MRHSKGKKKTLNLVLASVKLASKILPFTSSAQETLMHRVFPAIGNE